MGNITDIRKTRWNCIGESSIILIILHISNYRKVGEVIHVSGTIKIFLFIKKSNY